MLDWIKSEYRYLHGTFHGSSVILWSRLQVFLGTLWFSLQGIDLSPVLTNPKLLMGYLIFSNFVNESLRRSGAEYHPDGTIK
jgi:hypothetical protein